MTADTGRKGNLEMKEFELSKYVKKWLPFIIIACAALTVGVYLFLTSSQTYIASAVIRYEGEDAETGYTPNGAELDVNEIKSSSIMSQVIENLELDTSVYSVDNLISALSITEVEDEDEEARKEAVLEEGEEYEYKPTTYIVSFEAGYKEGESFARRVLDEVLDVYFAYYSEKYVNTSSTVNTLSGIDVEGYDYIEIMELIDDNISSALQTFNERLEVNSEFRSTITGMNYSDLVDEFSYLQSVEISRLFSEILNYQITKDKSLLISKYSERIKNNGIVANNEKEQTEDVVKIIDAYVEKMRESGNTNITYNYILDEVYDRDYTDSEGNVINEGDQTVTYDKLIYSWRDHNDMMEYSRVDTAYSNYIIDTFNKCTGACTPDANGATPCTGSQMTCSEMNNENYETVKTDVETEIQKVVDRLNELYEIVEKTDLEYNEYLGAANISTLSTVEVSESMNVKVYTALAAVFLMVICCFCAIVLGRLNDIVRYAFYTDSMTGMNNRNAFDSYLKKNDKKVLDDGTACVTVEITNQQELNQQFGRETGDSIIRFFADAIREAFGKTKTYMVYNGKSQFIIVAQETDFENTEQMLKKLSFLIDRRTDFTDAAICYEMGLSETGHDNIRKIRALLSKAVGSQRKYKAEKAEK